jgi:hypothetical protein
LNNKGDYENKDKVSQRERWEEYEQERMNRIGRKNALLQARAEAVAEWNSEADFSC